jgi:hypothetical protein
LEASQIIADHGHKPLPVNLAVMLFVNLWAIIGG